MIIGVTVSEIRKMPEILNDGRHEFIEVRKGQLKKYISRCDVLYMWNLVYDELELCIQEVAKLPKNIHIARQGKDNDLSVLAKSKNITLTYAENAFTDSISEFIVASVAMLAKGLHYSASITEWKKYPQKKIKDSKALILGRGNIAQASAILLENNGVKVQMAGKDEIQHINRGSTLPNQRGEELLNVDHLICCLPLNKSTEKLLGQTFFSSFNHVNFINISRGKIVDISGLTQAMDQGYVNSAVLDTFEEEPLPSGSLLWVDKRIVVSAHQSYFSPDWEVKIHESFVNLLRTLW
jgi:phosphoglycerate dehydrogenase-like enzyme